MLDDSPKVLDLARSFVNFDLDDDSDAKLSGG
jgi:hypothetical protein